MILALCKVILCILYLDSEWNDVAYVRAYRIGLRGSNYTLQKGLYHRSMRLIELEAVFGQIRAEHYFR